MTPTEWVERIASRLESVAQEFGRLTTVTNHRQAGHIGYLKSEAVLLREHAKCVWHPIHTAPRDGTWVLLRGESGYVGRPYRVHVGRWDEDYRPHNPWQTSEGIAFEDDGDPPTHWMPTP